MMDIHAKNKADVLPLYHELKKSAFKSNLEIPSFENVHVYPLIANILGLSYTDEINGKASVLKSILEVKPSL